MSPVFEGTPDQQWSQLMETRRKAGLEREIGVSDEGTPFVIPPQNMPMEVQEYRYEGEDAVFCLRCGVDRFWCDCGDAA